PGFVRAEPDWDVVGGCRASFRARKAVVVTVNAKRRALARIPDATDDVDCLAQGIHRLSRSQASPAHGFDRVPESTRAEGEAHAAAGEQVKTCRGASRDGGWAKR